MAIIRQPDRATPGASRLRAEAEVHAASLGQVRGTPGWGDAVRDYVLNLAGRDSTRPGAPLTSAEPAGIALAQLPPEMPPGRYWVPEMMRRPRHGFEEGQPKPPTGFWSALPRPPLAPKGPPGRRLPGELVKRHVTTPRRGDDSAPTADRIEEGTRRLPEERRQISERYGVPLSASPILDRYYSTMLAREDGLNKDGSLKVNHLGMVGPAQMDPDTAPDAARYAGIPFDRGRFRNDRAYNEVLGQAYYRWLVGRYGGDFVKAAAAYNWGPGVMQSALDAAQKAGEPRNWERHLPGETRNYVEFFRKFNKLQDD